MQPKYWVVLVVIVAVAILGSGVILVDGPTGPHTKVTTSVNTPTPTVTETPTETPTVTDTPDPTITTEDTPTKTETVTTTETTVDYGGSSSSNADESIPDVVGETAGNSTVR